MHTYINDTLVPRAFSILNSSWSVSVFYLVDLDLHWYCTWVLSVCTVSSAARCHGSKVVYSSGDLRRCWRKTRLIKAQYYYRIHLWSSAEAGVCVQTGVKCWPLVEIESRNDMMNLFLVSQRRWASAVWIHCIHCVIIRVVCVLLCNNLFTLMQCWYWMTDRL